MPEGVLMARNADLPLYLQRFDGTSLAEGPQMSFPLDGSTLRLAERNDGPDGMPLRADGGDQPYLWLVNGAPVEANRNGEALWQPDGKGFISISVTDAAGRTDGVDVFVDLVGMG